MAPIPSYTVTVVRDGRAVERVTAQGRQERDRIVASLGVRHPGSRIEAQGAGGSEPARGFAASWSLSG